ncbi:MAG: DJ-1/PfpI family protein [Candidatus Magasanikbacteria bacterium]|nr:DJ-1/PfpI family protein [Candidatus Magasanikbacteria bacterium]
MPKTLLFVIASEGFQPIEYGDAKKVLEAAGHRVVTVSDMAGKAITKDGSVTAVDLLVKDVILVGYDGLFFIGGPGALEHLDNGGSYELLREWQKTGKPYGAICISPRILAKAGVLQNKKATGWDGDGELGGILSAHGAEYVRQPVVVDGNVVTGNGPSAAREWGEKINEILNKR